MDYEVSHAYLDENIGTEQEKGINLFRKIRKKGDTSSLMIDDYNSKHNNNNHLSIENVINFYSSKGLSVDLVIKESEMVEIAKKMLIMIPTSSQKFRKDKKVAHFYNDIKIMEEFDDGRKKYSCVILSAAWHMKRAGMVKDSGVFDTRQKMKITSILPHKYRNIEDSVVDILVLFNCENNYIFY